MTMCRLCNNEASWTGWDRDPADTKALLIYVCGLHSLTCDQPMTAKGKV